MNIIDFCLVVVTVLSLMSVYFLWGIYACLRRITAVAERY